MVLFYSPPKKTVSPRTIELTIDSLDAFGQGIAHYQGKTVFVKNALPSERVKIKLTEDRKNYAKAKVTQYCNTSPVRTTALCLHYQVCGGCEMQHMSAQMQHHLKAEALVNLLKKEANYELTVTDIQVIEDKPYHYRRRARLALMWQNNQLAMGFRQLESSQIVDITVCPVLVPELEQLIVPLRSCLNRLKDKKALGHVELIHTESGIIVILRHIKPLIEKDKQILVTFAEQHEISLYLLGETLTHCSGSQHHYYIINDLTLEFSPQDFIQVNTQINRKMIYQAINWLDLQPTDHVLDLFCGMGNFSLPIAQHCHHVIGVEGVQTLVEKAKYNARINQQHLLAEVDFFVSNLDEVAKKPIWFTNKINKILLDPARAGAYHVMDSIIAHQPSHIVYISCNPATLVRDSKKLKQAGYKIVKASILDMFPQTKHIESMLLFKK